MGKTVIIINGKGGCGKDTLVNFVKTQIEDTWNVSSIDPVKKIATQFGYDENNKTDEWRKALSLMKEAFITVDYEEVTTYLFNKFTSFISGDYGDLMFVHVREPENIKKFINGTEDIDPEHTCKVYTVLIKRKDTDDKVYGNSSDDDVENYDYDYTFINEAGENIDKYRFMIFLYEEILK
jgi:hypothetical protein